MIFKPTPTGGRLAEGDTPHGRYRVEWDAAGELVSDECEPRNPNPVNLAVVNAHLGVCKECPYAGGVTTTKRNMDVYTIRCKSKRRGCAGNVSLRYPKRCPEGKW